MMIAEVVIEFADAVIDGENVRKASGDGAAASVVRPDTGAIGSR